MSESRPLLVENETDAWEKLEDGPDEPARSFTTMHKLVQDSPDSVLQFVRDSGVRRLGTIQVEDSVALAAIDNAGLATMGTDDRDLDWRAAWDTKLSKIKPKDSSGGWTREVTLQAFMVNIKDAAAPDVQGLLRPALSRFQEGACNYSVFGLPAMQAVIAFKWSHFAYRMLLLELGFFLLWLGGFTTFILLVQDEDQHASLHDITQTWIGKATVASEIVAVVGMAPFLLIEVSTIFAYKSGWVNFWNFVDCVTYVLQITLTVMHLGRIHQDSSSVSIMLALQCVLLWFRLQYFSRVFRPTKFSFVDTLRQVMQDVGWYLFFLTLIQYGFACAFYILFRQDQQHDEFSTVGHSMLTMVGFALQGADLDTMLDSHNPGAALVLAVTYQFVMSMVLMNLLIGIMTNSLDKSSEDADLKLLASKAEVIDELESTNPSYIEYLMNLYWHCYPSYIHVLRLDPESLELAPGDNEGGEWAEEEKVPAQVAKATVEAVEAAAAGPSNTDLAAKVDALTAQVAQLANLIAESMAQ